MPPNDRSPLKWIGGKFNSAERIVAAFPPAGAYDTYVEPFGGAAHVLFAKPPAQHLEVFNDLNGDLVNFWMQARDHTTALQARLDSLPYSRELYYDYHRRLWASGPEAITDPLERAAVWFFVQRSGMAGTGTQSSKPSGWGYARTKNGPNQAGVYRAAVELLGAVQRRFARVQIDNRDFARVIATYEYERALIYADPPYLDAESYYEGAVGAFTRNDHRRLAELLNATPAMVALSYYDHPEVDLLYPPARWRKMRWVAYKGAEKMLDGQRRQPSYELLLMNYPETHGGLFGGAAIELAPVGVPDEDGTVLALESEGGGEELEGDINLWTI